MITDEIKKMCNNNTEALKQRIQQIEETKAFVKLRRVEHKKAVSNDANNIDNNTEALKQCI
jgi:hypothetical protein